MDKQSFLERVRQAADLGTSKESDHHAVAVVVTLSHLKSPLRAEARPAPVEWTRDGFVQHVASDLDTHAARAEAILRGVYSILRDAISPGQIPEFEAQLPDDVRALLHQR